MTVRQLRHRIEYALVMVIRTVVRVCPDRAVTAMGAGIGFVFWAVDGAHRRLATRQLQAAFPSRTPRECRTITRKTFLHFGRSITLLLKFSTLSVDQIRKRVTFDGVERTREAADAGRGVLIITGHFGFWELQGMAHPLALPPITVLARPLDNPYLHALLERTRTATGNAVIYRKGAVRRVLRALGAGQMVAVLIDQHIQPVDAVTVQFFNRPASTTNAVAALALRTGAVVVPAFGLPAADGTFRMVYEHPIEPPGPDVADPLVEFTQRCTDVLEMYVRRNPELWLWMHRRWRDDDVAVRGMFPTGPEPDVMADDDDEGGPRD